MTVPGTSLSVIVGVGRNASEGEEGGKRFITLQAYRIQYFSDGVQGQEGIRTHAKAVWVALVEGADCLCRESRTVAERECDVAREVADRLVVVLRHLRRVPAHSHWDLDPVQPEGVEGGRTR